MHIYIPSIIYSLFRIIFHISSSVLLFDHILTIHVSSTLILSHFIWLLSLLKGIKKHLHLQPKELEEYEDKLERVLKRYMKRLQWLLSGKFFI